MISYIKSCLKNWRARHALIIILVAATMVLYILYSSSLAATQTQTLREVAPLENLLFEAKVLLEPGDTELNLDQLWPITDMDRQLGIVRWAPVGNYLKVEYGYEFSCQSTVGKLSVIGLSPGWMETSLPEEHLLGRLPVARQELLLPLNIARRHDLTHGDIVALVQIRGTQRHPLEFTIVGIYDSQEKQLPCIIQYEDALLLCSAREPNCLLAITKVDEGIAMDQKNSKRRPDLDTQRLVSFLQSKYPSRQIIYPDYPTLLGAEMHISVHGSSRLLLLLIFLFAGIAVYTVIFITFLERRKEMSSLKVIGISQKQVLSVYGMEYGVSFASGILGGVGLTLLAGRVFPWFQDVAQTDFLWLIAWAAFFCLALYLLTLAFPVACVAVASIDELLLNRTIPLVRQRISRPPAGNYLAKKYANEAGLSVLKLATIEDLVISLVLCSEGETVKEGQILAMLEEYGGLYRCVWVAPHDGVVTMLESGRYIGIRPQD